MSEYPAILSDLAEQVQTQLGRRGVARDVAEQIAGEVTEYIRRHWGGQQIYVPKGTRYDLTARDVEIYEKFNGRNFAELCRDYHLTEVRLRAIIREMRRKRRERSQTTIHDVLK